MSIQFLNSLKIQKIDGQKLLQNDPDNRFSFQRYSPFNNAGDYYLVKNGNKPKFLVYYGPINNKYILEIKYNGYIPKSGILLCHYLPRFVYGKKVLEIGCGETAIISIHSAVYGAKKVYSCDIVAEAVSWAEHNCSINEIDNIKLMCSDVYEKINSEERFDVIISNPPQMPMNIDSPHDSGGADGRLVINKIIDSAETKLHENGKLILLLFDFLGITKRYGKLPSISEILQDRGYKVEILSRNFRKVTPEGQTSKSMQQINMIYPKFSFIKDENGDLTHSIMILVASRTKHEK